MCCAWVGGSRKDSAANHPALTIYQTNNSLFWVPSEAPTPGCPDSETTALELSPRKLVGLSRFELLTPRLSSVCSNQLSYRPGLRDVLGLSKNPTSLSKPKAGSLKTRQSVFTKTVVEVLPDRSFIEINL